MKIIFAGTPEFAATALKALLNTPHEIIAVYTQPDRKSGRGQKVSPSPVKQVALDANIPVYQPLNFKASTDDGLDAQKTLQSLNADLMIVAAYGLILPQAILDMPKYGCLNIHASLLPRWRGAAPIQRAIIANDEYTGITIMEMAAGLDTGDMLLKTICPIEIQDTTATLHDKLAQQGGQVICEVIENEEILKDFLLKKEKQNNDFANYAHKITKEEALIDWSADANTIHRYIRAFNPWPICFTQINNENVRIWNAKVSDDDHTNSNIGEIISIDNENIKVQCGKKTTLNITSAQWPGGKPLNSNQIKQSNKLTLGQIL